MFPRAISVSGMTLLQTINNNLTGKEHVFKIKFIYRKTWWWKVVHYNYFHKRLFREFYIQRKKPFTKEEIKKYHRFQKIDDLITLRNVRWLREYIWRLEH